MAQSLSKSSTFGMSEAGRLSGLPQYSINNWVQRGLIEPSINLGPGRERGKRWTLRDLIGLRLIGELRRQGVSLQRVRKVIDKLRKLKGSRGSLEALAASRLVVLPDGDIALMSQEKFISMLTKPGQHLMGPVVAVDLEGHVAEIRKNLREAGIEEAA